MELIKAIFMGIIQGVTEFLPVSSSGHLAIFKYIFNMQDVSATFDVMLHVGTLAAVFVVYWKDIWKLICEGFSFLGDVFHNLSVFFKRNIARENVEYRRIIRSSYRKFTLLIIVSTIPTGIIGLAVKKSGLNDLMSSALIYPGICLLITGCVLMICDTFEEGYKTPKKTTFVDSIAECYARLFPNIEEDQQLDLLRMTCRHQTGYQPALAAAQQSDAVFIRVFPAEGIGHDRFQIPAFREDRHVFRPAAAGSNDTASAEIIGEGGIAQFREHFGIACNEQTVCHELMTQDHDGQTVSVLLPVYRTPDGETVPGAVKRCPCY